MKNTLIITTITFFSSLAAEDSIDSLVSEYMETIKLPSMCISVVTNDKIIHKKAYGYSNIEDKVKATTNTLYQVGSISKPISSVLFGICAEKGLVDYDDKLIDCIPFFKLKDSALAQEITFRDFLSHQSGYGCHDTMWYGKRYSRKEMLKKYNHLSPSLPLRKKFYYQNMGYMIAAHGLECLTEKSWEELVTENLFTPLGMNDTCLDVNEMQQRDDYSFGYTRVGDDIIKTDFVDAYTITPAGGVCSNLEDLTKFSQLLINRGGDLLGEDTVNEIFTPQVVTNFLGNKQFGLDEHIQMEAYGLGFFVISFHGKKIIFHGGNIQGFSSLIAFIPEDNIAVTILTNQNQTIAPFLLTLSIFEKLTSLECHPWLEKYQQFAEYEKYSIMSEREAIVESKHKNTSTSHELSKYTGRYYHKGYGDYAVNLVDGELVATFNDCNAPLDHWHYDVFNASARSDKYHYKNVKFHFANNFHGDVDHLSIYFDPFDGPIIFDKQPDNSLSEMSYLEKFVGDYSYYGVGFVITLEDDHIVVKALGQPPFHLKAETHCSFSVAAPKEGYEGYTVQFLENEESAVETIQLVQPDGSIFSAYKSNP